MSRPRFAALVAILAAVGAAWWVSRPAPVARAAGQGAAMVAVVMPETLSAEEQRGAQLYAQTCAACHGENGAGQEGVAPPLIHVIYEPSHHGDESFQIAVARGVRAHHWRFGNMPPQPGLTRDDVSLIVGFVRAVQRANGIR